MVFLDRFVLSTEEGGFLTMDVRVRIRRFVDDTRRTGADTPEQMLV
jgi:hypothetical protein